MIAIIYRSLAILVLMLLLTGGFGQPRIIKGTVYAKDGKRVAGVMVTADKSKGKYFTSFDGMYEINAKIKSKWLKFTFPDREEKMNIEGITRDVIDFGNNIEWNKPDTTRKNEVDKRGKRQ